MKKGILFDLIFIVLLAFVLVIISESRVNLKTWYLFIPMLTCYFIGRYVSFLKVETKKS
jgi:hypothetical protein